MFALFSACQDDDATFETDVLQSVSFEPMAGGAIMRYKLPADHDVFTLKVRYTDAEGNRILRVGSYACDTLTIIGFNEARQGVEAEVTLCNRQNVESKPAVLTFDTYDSAPVAFFKTAKIEPYWNGFSLIYEGSKYATGFAHVLFAGKDPMTQEPDTLFLETIQIKEGGDTIHFSLANPNPVNTVVIRTEDYRGYMVKQQVWKDVESYNIMLLKPEAFTFYTENPRLIIEDESVKLGKSYLFDGDTKGEQAFDMGQGKNDLFCTFLAGPNAVGEPFIVDFKEGEMPAYIRIYGMLNVINVDYFNQYWRMATYARRLPRAVTVYVSDDKSSWLKRGSFEDPVDDPFNAWVKRCPGLNADTKLFKKEQIQLADPAYITVNFPVSNKLWNYMKIVIDKVFDDDGNYVTFNELEIFVKEK